MPARSKLDDQRIGKICDGLLLGMTFKLAAAYAGIAESTLHDWRARGRSDARDGRDTPHAKLVGLMRDAEARNAAQQLRVVNEVARGMPPPPVTLADGTTVQPAGSARDRFYAAAWLLERRHGYVARTELRHLDGEDEQEEDWIDEAFDDPELALALARASHTQARRLAGEPARDGDPPQPAKRRRPVRRKRRAPK